MNCAWDALLSILPSHLRQQVDKSARATLQEIRIRLQCQVELIISGRSHFLQIVATAADIQFIVNTASRYSPWAATTIAHGYITAPGGHRIGLCGDCVLKEGNVAGIRTITSLCIRVAHGFPGIGEKVPVKGSLLLLGAPGSGKTTLLRDVIRIRSERGMSVSVVDERGELFPSGGIFSSGPRTDILTGCSKAQGVQMALRTMGPTCIAMDEITAPEDCQALLSALWCGVELLATAHAKDSKDLYARPIYRPLVESGLFEYVIILNRDKSWCLERMR